MRGETSKLGWEWEKKQVNKDDNERRNKYISMRMWGETSILGWEENLSKLGWDWEDKQVN